MIGHNKNIFITGGAKRLGRGIALKLAEQGYNIIIHYNHSKKEAQETQKDIQKLGRECAIYQCDFNDMDLVNEMINQIWKKFKRIDILINNASIYRKSSIKEEDFMLKWQEDMNIHIQTPLNLIYKFYKKQKTGQIINIIDSQIKNDTTEYTTYLLSKKMLAIITKLLVKELSPNIRINAIAPGYILKPDEGMDEDFHNKRIKNIPLKRQGSINNIYQSIKFLIENEYITGEIINNSGGE